MKIMKGFTRLLCVFVLCLLALWALPAAANAASGTVGGVDYEDNQDQSVSRVWANGNPLVIENGKIYIDSNRNSAVDADETQVYHFQNTSKGLFIYGGANNSNITANPLITLNAGEVSYIYLGNDEGGTLTGDAKVVINGGTVNEVYSTYMGTLQGNATIEINSGSVNIINCSSSQADGTVNGNVTVNIAGGTLGQFWPTTNGKVNGDIELNMTGGNIEELVVGYFNNGNVTGNVTVNATSGTVTKITDRNKSATGTTSVKILSSAGSLVNTDAPQNLLVLNSATNNWVLKGSVTISSGETLTITEGTTLIIPADATLTNNGTIVMNGRCENNGGKLDDGSGTKVCNSHTYVDSVCTFCGYVCTHGPWLDPTCTVPKTCAVCGKPEGDPLGHEYSYAVKENTTNVLVETCINNCGHTAQATLTAEDQTYTGDFIMLAKLEFDENWEGDRGKGYICTNNLEAGTATVTAAPAGHEISTTFEIKPYTIDDKVTVEFDPAAPVYTGQPQNPAVTVKFNGTEVGGNNYTLHWSQENMVAAGKYRLVVVGKHNFTGSMYADYEIKKADPAFTAPAAKELTYTGTEYELVEAGSVNPGKLLYSLDDQTYSEEIPTAIDAGTYTVYYKVEGLDTANYNEIPAGAVDVTVAKAVTPAIEFPTVLNEITYGQRLEEAKLSAYTHDLGTFNWTAPTGVPDAGTAGYALDFYPDASALQNYVWTDANGAQWIESRNALCICPDVTVNQAEMDVTAPTAKELTYNSEAQTLAEPGSCEQGIVEYSMLEDGTYGTNIPEESEAGTYTLWYRMVPSADNAVNYKSTQPKSIEVTVAKATPVLKDVAAADVKDTTDLDAVVVEYTVRDWEKGSLVIDAAQTLALGENTLTYTFTPNDAANLNKVTGTVAVKVLDTVAPTGEVTISTNTWNKFLNTVTFGKYYKETQTLSVTAADNLSGVAKIEYAESAEALTLEAVQTLTGWKQLDGSLSITAEDAKQFIYYVRITDKSGNVTYLSSDGAEFDTSAPAIAGVAGGVTYYTTQKVSVTDKNIDTVTVNGTPVFDPSSFTLPGDTEAEFVISAADKAGNTATVTVKMAPIADLSEAVADKTVENITAADTENLEKIIADAEKLLQEETLTAAEKQQLQETKAEAEELLAQVEAAEEALQMEAVENTQDTTAQNVTLAQKKEVAEAIETIESAMQTYKDNYTADEKQQLQKQVDALKAAAETIEKVETVQSAVKELPKTVEPDDEAAAAEILKVKESYDALTEHEKTLAKAEGEKLTALLEDLTDYRIVAGNGAEFNGESLTFTANGAYSKFVGLKINGKAVDSKYYTARSGSTIIALSKDYIKTLGSGVHTITVVYNDGETSGTFTVEAAAKADANAPATGDDANILLWSFMMFSAAAAVWYLNKKRHTA